MTLMQTIQEVTQLKREIDDQIRMIEDYQRASRQTMELVRTELKGSQRGFDQIMITSMNRSESALKKAVGELRRASSALQKVSSI